MTLNTITRIFFIEILLLAFIFRRRALMSDHPPKSCVHTHTYGAAKLAFKAIGGYFPAWYTIETAGNLGYWMRTKCRKRREISAASYPIEFVPSRWLL